MLAKVLSQKRFSSLAKQGFQSRIGYLLCKLFKTTPFKVLLRKFRQLGAEILKHAIELCSCLLKFDHQNVLNYCSAGEGLTVNDL